MSANYPSDLTDGQWQLIRKLLPKPAKSGRRPIDRRWIINAILYLNRTGCQWRALPHDFPKWKTVYTVFRRWRKAGVWARIHEALCRLVRQAAGKKPTPSVAIIDSQSIRTAEGGEERGYDAGKKITGRKRHIAVDTLGLIWCPVAPTCLHALGQLQPPLNSGRKQTEPPGDLGFPGRLAAVWGFRTAASALSTLRFRVGEARPPNTQVVQRQTNT